MPGILPGVDFATLTYDIAANPGWFANDAWTGDHNTWVSDYCCSQRGRLLNRLLDTPLTNIRMSGWLFHR